MNRVLQKPGLDWNLPGDITCCCSDHCPDSAKSRRLFNCREISSLNMAISVLFLTMARTVSSRKRATFSTCSRYLIAKSPSTDGKRMRLMMVRTQSVRLGVVIECQHRWKALLSVPGPNPVQGGLSRRCLQGLHAVQPVATMICHVKHRMV
jgi:hypothetical protein